ncbi:MAG: translation factor Sua5, partial [Acidobacteriota bacterium]|nr:translation factor Sua5 [Acidobacteriota bacterium]
RNASEVAGYFPRGLGLVIDGGAARTELPSTVLDVSGARPRLLREGVVPRGELKATLKSINESLD